MKTLSLIILILTALTAHSQDLTLKQRGYMLCDCLSEKKLDDITEDTLLDCYMSTHGDLPLEIRSDSLIPILKDVYSYCTMYQLYQLAERQRAMPYVKTRPNIDSMRKVFCDCFSSQPFPQTNADVTICSDEAFLDSMINIMDTTTLKTFRDDEWKMLELTCRDFNTFIRAGQELYKSEYLEELDSVPPVNSSIDCKSFMEHQTLYYYRDTGTKVFITIKDSIWQQNYSDDKHKYIRSKITNISPCEFELRILDTNFEDFYLYQKNKCVYRYIITEKKENYYTVVYTTNGFNPYKYKIYFK